MTTYRTRGTVYHLPMGCLGSTPHYRLEIPDRVLRGGVFKVVLRGDDVDDHRPYESTRHTITLIRRPDAYSIRLAMTPATPETRGLRRSNQDINRYMQALGIIRFSSFRCAFQELDETIRYDLLRPDLNRTQLPWGFDAPASIDDIACRVGVEISGDLTQGTCLGRFAQKLVAEHYLLRTKPFVSTIDWDVNPPSHTP